MAPTSPSRAARVGQVEHDGGVGGLEADRADGGVDEGRVAVRHEAVTWGDGGKDGRMDGWSTLQGCREKGTRRDTCSD